MTIPIKDLQQIIFHVVQKQKIGTLSLGQKRRQRELFFEKGNVYLLNRGNLHFFVPSPALSDLPCISDEKLFEIAQEIQDTNETVPDLLLRKNEIDEATYESLITIQITEEMLDAIFTCMGSFLFHDGMVPEDLLAHEGYASTICLSSDAFFTAFQQRKNELGEIRKLLPSLEEVPVISEKGLAVQQNNFEFEFNTIFELIDGFRSVQQIITDSPFYEATVLRNLYSFLNNALIKKTLFPELQGVDPHKITPRNATRYLPYFEQAVKHSVDVLSAMEQLAVVYTNLDKKTEAAAIYQDIGDLYAQKGKNDEAVGYYNQGLTLVPNLSDLLTRRYRIFLKEAQGTLQKGDFDTTITLLHKAIETIPDDNNTYLPTARYLMEKLAQNELRQLIEKAILFSRKTGWWNASYALLAQLDEHFKHDLSFNKKVTNLLLETGKQEEALKRMEAIARKYVERDEKQKARAIYEKILKITPKDEAVKEKLDALCEKKPVSIHKVFLIKIAAAAVLLIVVMYQLFSFLQYRSIAGAEELPDRIAQYKRFMKKNPLSLSSYLAYSKAQDAELMYKDQLLEQRNKLNGLFEKARVSETIGERSAAIEIYRSIADEDDREYSQKAAQRIEELTRQEEQARALLSRAQTEEEAKHFDRAFSLMQRLQKDYAGTEAALKRYYPIIIESTPPGADIKLNGKNKGTAPLTLQVHPGETLAFTVSMEHYKTEEIILNELTSSTVSIELSRSQNWETALPKTETRSLVAHQDLLFAAGNDGAIHSWRTEDGRFFNKWKKTGSTGIAAGPLLVSDAVVFASNDGTFCILPKHEKEMKVFPAGGLVREGFLALSDEAICYPTNSRSIRTISTKTGRIQWEVRIPANGTARAAGTSETVIFLCQDDILRAYAKQTGRFRWEMKASKGVHLATWGDLLLVGDGNKLSLLEATWGNKYWEKEFTGTVTQLLFDKGLIWAALDDGAVYKLDSHTGDKLTEGALKGPVNIWCLADGKLVVSVAHHPVVCVDAASLEREWLFKHKGQIADITVWKERVILLFSEGKLVSVTL